MPIHSQGGVGGTFARAVDALCLSRHDVARLLGLSVEQLDAYTSGDVAAPPMTQLELVDLVKAHEARLGAAAGRLYEESMDRLERSGLAGAPARARPLVDASPARSSAVATTPDAP